MELCRANLAASMCPALPTTVPVELTTEILHGQNGKQSENLPKKKNQISSTGNISASTAYVLIIAEHSIQTLKSDPTHNQTFCYVGRKFLCHLCQRTKHNMEQSPLLQQSLGPWSFITVPISSYI